MIGRLSRRTWAAVAAGVFGLVAVTGLAVAVAAGAGGGHHARSGPVRAHTAARTAPVSPPGPWGANRWSPVPPATVVPPDTPTQRAYDQSLQQGLASSPTVAAAEAAWVPGPAVSGAWQPLPPVEEPDVWTESFVRELLDIDFARQTRDGLGQWLVAEEAPELFPGVPASVQNKVLYLSLFDPGPVGGGATPLPSSAAWAADATGHVSWSVGGLIVSPDAQWSRILTSGWQPVDLRFAVEDVSGLLTISQPQGRTQHRFAMKVYLGSAHWQEGYGTVLVDDWSLS